MDVAQALREAIEVIGTRWHKGAYDDGEGNMCLAGALGWVTGALVLNSCGFLVHPSTTHPAQRATPHVGAATYFKSARLWEQCKRVVREHLPEGYESIPLFNDDPRTTCDDVIRVVEKALASL